MSTVISSVLEIDEGEKGRCVRYIVLGNKKKGWVWSYKEKREMTENDVIPVSLSFSLPCARN